MRRPWRSDRVELVALGFCLMAGPFGAMSLALKPNPGPIPCSGHFSTVLEEALERLEQGDEKLQEHLVHATEDFACIHDGYPKAAVHLLVLPRRHRIEALSKLTRQHLPLLQRHALRSRVDIGPRP